MNPFSLSARHNLGQALYASGQFENALKNFYRACRSSVILCITELKKLLQYNNFNNIYRYRIKRSVLTEEWIGRCEETIKLFFESVNLDLFLVSEMLGTDLFKTCIFKQMIIKADDKLIDNQ